MVRRKEFCGWCGAVLAAMVLTGCAVSPEPFALDDHAARAEADLATLFAGQEVVSGPISLAEAPRSGLLIDIRFGPFRQTITQASGGHNRSKRDECPN